MATEFEQAALGHLETIATQIKKSSEIFSKVPIGGAGDNSDIVDTIKKDSDDKNKALAKEQEKLYKKLQKDLNIKKEISSLSDVIKENSQAKALEALGKRLTDRDKKEFSSEKELQAELDELGELAKAAGTSLKALNIEGFKPARNALQKQVYVVRDGVAIGKTQLKQAKNKLKATAEVIEKQKELSESYDKVRGTLKKWGGEVKKLGKNFLRFAEQEQRFMQATATADAGWIDGVLQMNISQLEYMKILKDTRQESLAASAGGVDFTSSLSASASSLRGFTANSEDAAKGAAAFHKNMARMGVSQNKLGDAVAQQTTIYKEHYRGLGYTVEEFANLTNELINDQGMRSTLLSLQEDERAAYIKGIQQRTSEYITMGYSIDRAKELQKTFQDIIGMNPKDRMKKAAKERAMLGAMGMGAEAAELFKLTTGLRTSKTRDTDQKRITEIRGAAATQFGAMSGSGVSQGQAMSMQMLADSTGFTEIATTFETESGKGLKVSQDQLKKLNEISDAAKFLLSAQDTWGALTSSALGSIGTGIALLAGGKFLGKLLPKILGKIVGRGGGGGGIISGGVKMATSAAGALGLGAAAMSSKAAAPAAVKGATSATAGIVAKGLTKGAAKTALKAIPGLGLIAALGFMGSRLADGDFLGAGMELASGALGVIPGIGTVASVAMSGAIVARDISKANEGMDTIVNADGTTTPSIDMAAKKETKVASPMDKLNKTLESIDGYIRTAGETNTELAVSMRSLGITMEETARMSDVPGYRPSS